MTGQDLREITVPAVLGEVDRLRAFLRDYLAGTAFGEEARLKIELALHEICVNVAQYAYPPGRGGEVAVRVWKAGGSLFIEVRDRGVPFNPLEKENPDLMVKLRRGERGGYGIYFFRTLMDGLAYRRAGGQNVLTVRKDA